MLYHVARTKVSAISNMMSELSPRAWPNLVRNSIVSSNPAIQLTVDDLLNTVNSKKSLNDSGSNDFIMGYV